MTRNPTGLKWITSFLGSGSKAVFALALRKHGCFQGNTQKYGLRFSGTDVYRSICLLTDFSVMWMGTPPTIWQEQSVSSKLGGVLLKSIKASADQSQCEKMLNVKRGQKKIHTKYEFNHFLSMKVYVTYAEKKIQKNIPRC